MTDPVLEAAAQYERDVAPAYEVIRRARNRLLEQLAAIAAAPVPGQAVWLRQADPTEPNGAEYAVEGAIEHPEQGHPGAAAAPSAPVDAAPESQPGQEVAVEPSPSVPAPRSAAASSPPGDGSPATPLLVKCPQCDEKVKPQGLGSHQRKHKPGYRAPGAPTPAGTMATCPECGAEVKAMGLGTHRRQKHGRGRRTTLVKPPATDQPGSARSGQRERARPGRRAPSAAADAPSSSSSEPVGTPTPVSQPSAGRRASSGTAVQPPPAASSTSDKRVLSPAEECPKGCGRRFTWEPSLNSHAGNCSGKKAVA